MRQRYVVFSFVLLGGKQHFPEATIYNNLNLFTLKAGGDDDVKDATTIITSPQTNETKHLHRDDQIKGPNVKGPCSIVNFDLFKFASHEIL